MTPSDINSGTSVNPFPSTDADKRAIWEILMTRDFEAFVNGDWSHVDGDFWKEGFSGVHANKRPDPSQWTLLYSDITGYRDEWLRQVQEFGSVQLQDLTILSFLYQACRLEEIDIAGDRAIARKKFNGKSRTLAGEDVVLRFQTLYQLIRIAGRWKISGFIGYLPNPMPAEEDCITAETPW